MYTHTYILVYVCMYVYTHTHTHTHTHRHVYIGTIHCARGADPRIIRCALSAALGARMLATFSAPPSCWGLATKCDTGVLLSFFCQKKCTKNLKKTDFIFCFQFFFKTFAAACCACCSGSISACAYFLLFFFFSQKNCCSHVTNFVGGVLRHNAL